MVIKWPLKPDASHPAPGLVPSATRTRQPSWPLHQDSTPPLLPHGQHGRCAGARGGRGIAFRDRVPVFPPEPSLGKWGTDADERDRGRERQAGQGHSERNAKSHAGPLGSRDPEQKAVKTGRETHEVPASGRKAVGGRNQQERTLSRERLRCQGRCGPGCGFLSPTPVPHHQPGPGRPLTGWAATCLRGSPGSSIRGGVPREPHRPREASDSSAEEPTRVSVEATLGPRL